MEIQIIDRSYGRIVNSRNVQVFKSTQKKAGFIRVFGTDKEIKTITRYSNGVTHIELSYGLAKQICNAMNKV